MTQKRLFGISGAIATAALIGGPYDRLYGERRIRPES